MLSGCKVSCFTKSSSREQISYQHQLSRGLPWLSVFHPTLPMFRLSCVRICFSSLSYPFSPLPISSSCVLCGIKVWIGQMDRASNQSERSILPRLAEKICPDWQTSDGSDLTQLGHFPLILDQLNLAWFGLSPTQPRSCLAHLFSFWNVEQFCSQMPSPICQSIYFKKIHSPDLEASVSCDLPAFENTFKCSFLSNFVSLFGEIVLLCTARECCKRGNQQLNDRELHGLNRCFCSFTSH